MEQTGGHVIHQLRDGGGDSPPGRKNESGCPRAARPEPVFPPPTSPTPGLERLARGGAVSGEHGQPWEGWRAETAPNSGVGTVPLSLSLSVLWGPVLK